MAKAEGIPPTASTASVGLGINYIGNHIYGYNQVDVGQSDTDIFSFISGNGYIVGNLQLNYAVDQSENCIYKVHLNDTQVQGWVVSGGISSSDPEQPLLLLIPPQTIVLVTGILLSGSSTRQHFGTLLGRVYGV